MKRALQAVAVCLGLGVGVSAGAVTLEEFQKLSLQDRLRAMEGVPPELKEVFRKASLHQYLLERNGGEEGYKFIKERYLIGSRDLIALENIFEIQVRLWEAYSSGYSEQFAGLRIANGKSNRKVETGGRQGYFAPQAPVHRSPQPCPASEAFGGGPGAGEKSG